MSGRGRRAVPPPAEHRGDPPPAAGGLVVTVVNAAGHGKVFDFADLAVPEPMQRSLAAVFAAQSGRWNSHRSAEGYWNQLIVFARFLAGLDSVPQDVDGLTAAVLKRWRTRHIGTNGGRIALKTVRTLLLHDARLGSGAVAEELARRVPNPKPSKQSYGEAERERVLLVARRQFRSASLRIRENTLLLERWRAGDLAQGSREWRIGRLLDHLADTGDVPRTASASGRGRVSHRRILGGAGVERTWGRLFLTRAELTALAVLLTDRFGWNLSVYDRMPAPTAAPSAGERSTVTYQVQVEKHRAGAGRWWSTENVTDSGADSPGRLITSALEATAHGRALAARLAPGTDLLMTARTGMTGRRIRDRERPRPVDPLCFGVSAYDATHWALGHGMSESPFQRIRRTTVTREARPLQHSRGTHDSVYVLPDRHVQDTSRTVFAAGAQDALDQARATTFGGRLADTPDPAHQAAATVDCVDETTSPWPAPDGGCGTDFLLCLACRNAHVHPGHHPRLAHLHRQVESLRSVLPGPVWDRRWREHLLRLADLRDQVGPAAWNAALARVDDTGPRRRGPADERRPRPVTAPAADDPYVLPMPAGDTPVVLPRWISPANLHPNSRYRDMVWSLAPLIDNPSTGLVSVHWKNCPAPLRDQLKPIAWTMINGQLRPTQLKTRGHRARARPSAGEQRDTCLEWMRLARWLYARGISDLAACADHDWAAYAEHRRSGGIGRGPAGLMLGRLTDLWAFDGLTAHPAGVTRPVWEVQGVDDHLPPASGETGGENTTEPLDPHVIGPLLTWAMRMVEDLADDILAAWAERNRLTGLADTTASTPAGRAALEAYLSPLIHHGSPLPAVQHKGVHAPARTFIAATTGASPMQVDRFVQRHGLAALVAQRPGPCPLLVPVTGHIEGHPWRERIDFTEATTLMRHLGTAAMIICLYLTGMRPQEVQGLRSGCCPDPDSGPDDTAGPHLIRGHHYKNVTDEDGNHLSAGEERELPSVAITPVVHAIRVLERIVPDGELLFSAVHHDTMRRRSLPGALKGGTLNQRIDDFVLWANREAVTQGLPHQHIPDDPGGTISLTRFRRTLAWHIARRPGGLIALAVQYGHMRTALDAHTSTGYATRARRGIHGVLDVETALAAADTAARLRDRLAAGEKISGPAARRALTAAATTPRFEGRIVPWTFARKAAAFLARDGLILFDNPDAHLICVFKRDTALCAPGPDAIAPNQYDCTPGCGNTVRTDTHARLLHDRAAEIRRLADHAPGPLGTRLRHHADRLRALADDHAATARPAQDPT